MKGMFTRKPSDDVVPRRRLRDSNEFERTAEDKRAYQTLFRKNTTITGSKSARVESAVEHNAHLSSPRAHIHHLRSKHRFFQGMLVLCVLAMGLLGWFLYEFSASVTVALEKSATPLSVQQSIEYERAFSDYFAQNPTQRMRSSFDPAQAVAFFASHGRGEIAQVSKPTFDALGVAKVTLGMRTPLASWMVNGKTKYVDANGVIFECNYFSAPPVKVIDENTQLTDATTASTRFVMFIGRAVEALAKYQVRVKEAVIPKGAIRYVDIVTDKDERVRVSIDRSEYLQAEDAGRAIKHVRAKNISATLLDVRVENKVFYTVK